MVYMDGGGYRGGSGNDLATLVLGELGISGSNAAKMQSVPTRALMAARDVAIAKSNAGHGGGWGPVVDGTAGPGHPFDPSAPAISAKAPMLTNA